MLPDPLDTIQRFVDDMAAHNIDDFELDIRSPALYERLLNTHRFRPDHSYGAPIFVGKNIVVWGE
jgi:hypothetical protein